MSPTATDPDDTLAHSATESLGTAPTVPAQQRAPLRGQTTAARAVVREAHSPPRLVSGRVSTPGSSSTRGRALLLAAAMLALLGGSGLRLLAASPAPPRARLTRARALRHGAWSIGLLQDRPLETRRLLRLQLRGPAPSDQACRGWLRTTGRDGRADAPAHLCVPASDGDVLLVLNRPGTHIIFHPSGQRPLQLELP